jgi:hypothetical protein
MSDLLGSWALDPEVERKFGSDENRTISGSTIRAAHGSGQDEYSRALAMTLVVHALTRMENVWTLMKFSD